MPRRLRDLTVDWGSLVDNPANKGATVALFKRDDSQDVEKRLRSWLADHPVEKSATAAELGSALAAVAKMHGDPMTFDDVREAAANERVLGEVMGWVFGFRRSVESILEADPDAVEGTKADLLSETLEEFVTALRGAVPQWANGETVGKADVEEDHTMDEKTLKALVDGLPEKSRAAVEKALRAEMKIAADEKAARAKVETESAEQVEALEKRATELEAKVEELSKKEESPDDVLKSVPEAIRKRLEAAEKRAEDAEKTANAERSARELSEITKRVETEMPHLVGTAAEKAELLQRLKAAVTPEDFAKWEETLRAASKSIEQGALFSELGAGAPAGSATQKLEAIAEELRKADPSLRKAASMMEAAKRHPELRREQLAEQRSH